MSELEARSRFYLVDRQGLLVDSMSGLQPFQLPFAQRSDRVASWKRAQADRISLADVVVNAHPTALIGTSGQARAITEDVVRNMAKNTDRPVIFPLSNPTDRCEATPADLCSWTEGRAVIATGSPFPPVKRNGKEYRVDQNNNAYVYPGIGLGAIVCAAHHISDGMFLAAARALAELSPQGATRMAIFSRHLLISGKSRSKSPSLSPNRLRPKGLPKRRLKTLWRRPSRKRCGIPPTRYMSVGFAKPELGCAMNRGGSGLDA